MIDQDQVKLTRKFARQVIKRMDDMDLPAEPDHYETLYFYVSGRNSRIIEDINKILSAKGRLTADEITRLHEQHFSKFKMNTEVDNVASELTDELGEILSHIKESFHASEKTTNDLANAGVMLDRAESKDDIRSVVDELVTAVAEFKKNNENLKSSLNESQSQVMKLQNDLESVRTEANLDGLTALSNRKHFDLEMERIYKGLCLDTPEYENCALIMLDIDHFKSFNDTFGHQTGDQVIRLVAHCIKNAVKGQDFPARYGGEEFAIILPNTSLSGALSLAENIRKSVMAKELVKKSTGENLGRVTVSLGVAKFDHANDTPSSLIERADKALYDAKKAGRNCVMTLEKRT